MPRKYQAYPEYKDSGVEWLGDIPTHWDAKRLGQFFEERREKVSDTDYPALSVTMQGIVPQLETAAKTDAGDNRKLVIKNDFVINSRSDRKGSSGVSPFDGSVSLISIVMEPRRIVPSYVHHLLRSYPFQEEFYRYGKGIVADLWSTNSSEMKNILIPKAPEEEQKAIADFLDHETAKIDTLIEKQQQLIKLLKEKHQAVISHAVTKGLNPNAPMRDSGIEWLGEVPAHWAEVPLKALLGLKHGYAFDSTNFADSGDYILMTPGNFNQRGGFRHKAPEKHYVGTDIPEDFILESGQMLLAMTEQGPGLLGCALFVPDKDTYLHNQRLGLVRNLRDDKVSEKYLFHLFNSSRCRAEVSVSSTGAKVKHTSPEKILSIKIWIPPLSEQKKIARFIDEMTDKINDLEVKAEQTIFLLRERRTALISAAVTGKIDVRNHAFQN